LNLPGVQSGKSFTAPYTNRLLQKAKIAFENKELEKALNIYTQILQAVPPNFQALCNVAMIRIEMKNFGKALIDLEAVIKVNQIYYDAWYLSLMAHLGLGGKKGAEQDIGHIKYLDIQRNAYDIINEYVNKLEHFDVEWFKILVDSCPHQAMLDELYNINQWQ